MSLCCPPSHWLVWKLAQGGFQLSQNCNQISSQSNSSVQALMIIDKISRRNNSAALLHCLLFMIIRNTTHHSICNHSIILPLTFQIQIRNLYEKIPPKPIKEECDKLKQENDYLRSKLEELGVHIENGAPLAGAETDVSYYSVRNANLFQLSLNYMISTPLTSSKC